jgi:hypothetical protein
MGRQEAFSLQAEGLFLSLPCTFYTGCSTKQVLYKWLLRITAADATATGPKDASDDHGHNHDEWDGEAQAQGCPMTMFLGALLVCLFSSPLYFL